MTGEGDLPARLHEAPVAVDCAICRHRQWLRAERSRCDQCGSEIEVFVELAAAERRLASFAEAGRTAYLQDAGGLFAVVANRAFFPRS